jgi:hypothetical protein
MQKTATRCGQRNFHDAVRLKELGAASGRARPSALKAARSKNDFFFQLFRFDAPA